jgi:hypothetical protein
VERLRRHGTTKEVTLRAKAKDWHPTDNMNKTEAAYWGLLMTRKQVGEILHFMFEPVGLRLGKKCFYHPDFMVTNADRTITFHEVKGYWREDARVKIKVAAKMFPMFSFVAVQRGKGRISRWTEEEF